MRRLQVVIAWMILGLVGVLLLVSIAAAQGDPKPNFQYLPVLGVTTNNEIVKTGDLTNHALRVNVVAGSGSGVSGTIGTAQGTTVAPAGAVDPSGFVASLSVSNTGHLNVTCNNCSSSSATFAAAFPAFGGAAGFKDGGGKMASASVDNAGNLFVIASQSSSAWTVTATGTISSHQADTWNVGTTNWLGSTAPTVGQKTSANSVPVVIASDQSAITVSASLSPNGTISLAYPSTVFANFKDGAGKVASAVVDQSSNLLVIASQGAANATPWNENVAQWLGSTAPTVGQKTSANSIPVVIASDQSAVTVTGSVTASITPNGTVSLAYPSTVWANFKDGAGKVASAAVDQSSNVLVIASQGAANSTPWNQNVQQWLGSTAPTVGQKTSANSVPVVIASDQSAISVTGTVTATVTPNGTVALTYPSTVWANFKDGSGKVASAVVDNASNLFVIASQGTTNWVTNVAQWGGTTVVNGGTAGVVGIGGPTASGSQASANPIRNGAVGRPTNKPTIADGNVADLIVSGSGDLYVRDDTSAATGTLAPSRVQMQGGIGKNGVATAVTVCDQFATFSMGQQTNVQVITSPGAGQIHICSVIMVVSSATSVSIFEGSGTLCNTNRVPIFGSTATINGLNLATTGGFTLGTGVGDVGFTQFTGSNVCLGNSTSAVVTGGIKWTSY